MKNQTEGLETKDRSGNIHAVIAGLAGDLTKSNPRQRPAVEEALKAMLAAAEGIRSLAGAEPPTIVVEVEGGLVEEIYGPDDLPFPIRVLVRDHDRQSDPELVESEWLIGPGNGHEG